MPRTGSSCTLPVSFNVRLVEHCLLWYLVDFEVKRAQNTFTFDSHSVLHAGRCSQLEALTKLSVSRNWGELSFTILLTPGWLHLRLSWPVKYSITWTTCPITSSNRRLMRNHAGSQVTTTESFSFRIEPSSCKCSGLPPVITYVYAPVAVLVLLDILLVIMTAVLLHRAGFGLKGGINKENSRYGHR